jgi:hypothetical protein
MYEGTCMNFISISNKKKDENIGIKGKKYDERTTRIFNITLTSIKYN